MNRFSFRALLMASSLLIAMVATASPATADLDAGAGSIIKPIGDTEAGSDSTESEPTYTEDTDTNDDTENNVSDDGDNAHPSGNDRSVESGGSGNQGSSTSNPDDSKGPQRYEGARGEDKPNGPGGTDLDDQDGNNGCGNDDDFNDDNNGRCGKSASPDNSCSKRGHSGWECSENDSLAGTISDCSKGKMADGCNNLKKASQPVSEIAGRTDEKVRAKAQPVLPEDEVQAAAIEGRTDKACPAGTDDAGRAMQEADCNEGDSVLGKVLQKAGPLGAAVKGVGAAVGAVLPFTGNGDLVAFLAIALGLIVGGLLLLKKRKTA